MELSQEEIDGFKDALETNAVEGSVKEKEVRSFDFLHPDKLSKVHLRVLQSLFSVLERTWSGTLSSLLRLEATVTLDSIEQVQYGAFASSLPAQSTLSPLLLGGLPGTGYFGMPGDLALATVDRLAGGSGQVIGDLRELSQIEFSILKRLLDRLIVDIRIATKPVSDIEFAIGDQIASSTDSEVGEEEMFLVVGLSWQLVSETYKVALAIPVDSLDSIREFLTPEHCMQSKASEESAPKTLASELLGGVRVEAAVELGRARVSMSDVAGLGIGDVIMLDRSASDPLTVTVQEKKKFNGRPGLVGNKMAIQITESLTEAVPPQPEQEKEAPVPEVA